MESEFISTLYTAYMTLSESNHLLFQRINQLEERINSINIVEHKYNVTITPQTIQSDTK